MTTTRTLLDEAIYQKYIVPTEREAGRWVGPEFEFPVISLHKCPVSIPGLQEVVKAFAARFGFSRIKRDDNGDIYSLADPVTGDDLSFDCSFNTLELSFGKERSIVVLDGRFRQYYAFLQKALRRRGMMLTGMGANPYHRYNTYAPIANDRYRMLAKYLRSYRDYGMPNAHDIPEFSMICAASQVQLDVARDNIIETINTFGHLEPVKALLFANSLFDRLPDLLISRDYLWRYSTQGYDPHNLDMYAMDLHDLDEYIAYVRSQSMYCVEKDGMYLHFKPIVLEDYVQREAVEGTYFDGETWRTHVFTPGIEDIAHLRTFKFEDLTYRGTIEFRSACEQPVSEVFCHAAFHAGLAERTDELAALLEADTALYGHGFTPAELREIFTYRELPYFVDRRAVSDLLTRVVALAEEGLHDRGLGEERYLKPLYDRAARLTNPAREMAAGLARGDAIEDWIERYAALD